MYQTLCKGVAIICADCPAELVTFGISRIKYCYLTSLLQDVAKHRFSSEEWLLPTCNASPLPTLVGLVC